MNEDRHETLIDHKYIKMKLCSADPRFLLNQRYVFFLLNNCHLRQINGGIFHMMNVVNPREKYTAKRYLEKLARGELEGNLNIVFERIWNTEQYWTMPKNNLLCMARYYGPATWFLTLSPAQWLWKDMITYIREVNAPNLDKLSANAIIAADPVSVSRFLDNKFRAMLDFLLSDSHIHSPLR